MSKPTLNNKIVVMAGFVAAKKTTIASLLVRKGSVKVIFDADWGAEGLYGAAYKLGIEHTPDEWRNPALGSYAGLCVEALYRHFKSACCSISLGDNNYAAFMEKLSGPIVKIALIYDPKQFRRRWLFDTNTELEDTSRSSDKSLCWIEKQATTDWKDWAEWFHQKGFSFYDVTDKLKLSELERVADEIIATGGSGGINAQTVVEGGTITGKSSSETSGKTTSETTQGSENVGSKMQTVKQ